MKQFGNVWQQTLYQLNNEILSIRDIARRLGVDSKTVKKIWEKI